jgi:hypothetical protein
MIADLISESQTPVLNDVRDITVVQTVRGGVVALISYENSVLHVVVTLDLLMTEHDRHLLNFGN